jgi:hypothetical protein
MTFLAVGGVLVLVAVVATVVGRQMLRETRA